MLRFAQQNAAPSLSSRERRRLGTIVIAATATLAALIVVGLLVERQARTPLIQVGQPAPDWTLPAAGGTTESLAAQRGHSVLLAFLPSVNCPSCLAQLRALQAAQPKLRARDVTSFAISTDLPAVQRSYSATLKLDYPLLSEAPAFGLHPVGTAYGVYHGAASQAGPVDLSALIVIDAAGMVRAVSVLPSQSIGADQLVDLVESANGTQ